MEAFLFIGGLILAAIALASIIFHKPKESRSFEQEFKDTLEQLGKTKQQLDEMKTQYILENAAKTVIKEAYQKLQFQKKSSEVKVGQTVEQLVGFLEDFPYPDDEIKALYQPLDLIVFREDEIVFVEVKSGEAQLSEKQRKLRDIIEAKKVRFEVHRINGKGYKIK